MKRLKIFSLPDRRKIPAAEITMGKRKGVTVSFNLDKFIVHLSILDITTNSIVVIVQNGYVKYTNYVDSVTERRVK